MITILTPATAGKIVSVRCACGVEFTARRADVKRGHTTRCAACRPARKTPEQRRERLRLNRKLRDEKRRKPEEMPKLVMVPRFVPASTWRTDTAVIGALLIALRLPLDELSFLSPIDADVLRELAGLDADDLDRPGLRRWLEADALGRVYGVRCPASLVFGTPREAVGRKAA